MPVGFALEHVVHVGALAVEKRDQTRDEISGKKERPPAFALADVDALVSSRGAEKLSVAAAEEGAVAKEEGDHAAVQLDYAVDYPRPPAAQQRGQEEEQADEGGRHDPEVNEDAAEVSGLWGHRGRSVYATRRQGRLHGRWI